MTNRRNTIISAAIAMLLIAVLVSRPASADPQVTAETSYNHAPVTFWLVPNVGTAGLSSGKLRTNFALSLGASAYARLDGVDLGVGASWITEDMHGAQVTAGFNYAGGDAEGAQISAGANVTGGRMTGVQIALVNVGGQVRGAQIGLVNVATGVKGTQIGLVNVADDSSAPLGVVNVIKNGQHHIGVWGSDSAPVNFGIKLGGKHVYSLLAAGFESSDGKQRWMAGLGVGAHLPLGERFYLEPELLTSHVNEGWTLSKETNQLSSLRLIGGYRVHRDLSVFMGPTLNLLVTRVGDGEGFGLIHGTRLSSEGSETTVRLWPGFVAGFQI